jgi:hypothetical protein
LEVGREADNPIPQKLILRTFSLKPAGNNGDKPALTMICKYKKMDV